MTDPIADALTRIRNASMARRQSVAIPYSKLKEQLLALFVKEGYIRAAKKDGYQLIVELSYRNDATGRHQEPAVIGIRRISKPSLRVYVPKHKLPRVSGGMGMSILSTSQGLMTDRQARKLGIGGEVLCTIW